MKIYTTLVFSQTPVNKVFSSSKGKSSNTVFAGTGATAKLTMQALVDIFNIDPNQESSARNICLVPGINVNYSHYALTTLENKHLVGTMRDAISTPSGNIPALPYQTKTNDCFSYDWKEEYGILTLDCDQKERPLKERVTPEFLLQYVLDSIPEISSVQKIIKLSSSNCYRIGETPPEKSNFHLFIAVPFPYIVKVGEYLRKKLVIDGYGFLRVGDKGTLTVQSLIDKSAYDKPSGIIFTARPTYDPNKYEYNHRCELIENTSEMSYSELCLALDKYDHKSFDYDFNQQKTTILNNPERIAFSKEKKAKADEDFILKKMNEGLSRKEATEFLTKIDNKILPISHIVEFAEHGWITLERAIELNLHDVYCCDPVEHDIPEYAGIGRAKLINDTATEFDKGRGWYIHSFLHEVKNIYLVEDPNKQDILDAITGKVNVEKETLPETNTTEPKVDDFIIDPQFNYDLSELSGLKPFDDIAKNTLDLLFDKYNSKNAKGNGALISRKWDKKRKEYSVYDNSKLIERITGNITYHCWKKLCKQAKTNGEKKPRNDHKERYRDNIKRLLDKVLVEKCFRMDVSPNSLKKVNLSKNGVKVSANNTYNMYRTWSEKLPLMLDVMAEMEIIKVIGTNEPNVVIIESGNDLITIDTMYQITGRDVWIDDNFIYFESTQNEPYINIEKTALPQELYDYIAVGTNVNRQNSKMNYPKIENNMRLIFSSPKGSVKPTNWRIKHINDLDKNRNSYYHKDGENLTKLKPLYCGTDLKLFFAVLHDIQIRSLKKVRHVVMTEKTKGVLFNYAKASYQKNGIPTIPMGDSENGLVIYTTQEGFRSAERTMRDLKEGLFTFNKKDRDKMLTPDRAIQKSEKSNVAIQVQLEKMENIKNSMKEKFGSLDTDFLPELPFNHLEIETGNPQLGQKVY